MMGELIRGIFASHFDNDILNRMEDAALLPVHTGRIAFTTDSFVVDPLFFPGGDIGRLAVCGTVNDLLMRGATPKYLSAGFILEEGLEIEVLERVASSMREAADEAGVRIVAGDTKVIEGHGRGGLYLNTAGIGLMETEMDISAHNASDGDAVLVSGTLGEHHACILSARMGVQNNIHSDCAPLTDMVANLLQSGTNVHAMRDLTRGGLATALHEIAQSSGVRIVLDGSVGLANDSVQGFCDILGLDPLYMGNEGKIALILPQGDAAGALEIIRRSKYGERARIVGKVVEVRCETAPGVAITTRAGGERKLEPLLGEGLPRIC